jgi:hypothetical protein
VPITHVCTPATTHTHTHTYTRQPNQLAADLAARRAKAAEEGLELEEDEDEEGRGGPDLRLVRACHSGA